MNASVHANRSSCPTLKHYLKQILMLPITFVRTVCLRHGIVLSNFMVAAILYIIFVVIDVVKLTNE